MILVSQNKSYAYQIISHSTLEAGGKFCHFLQLPQNERYVLCECKADVRSLFQSNRRATRNFAGQGSKPGKGHTPDHFKE